MSRATNSVDAYVPAPIDGLNLIANPTAPAELGGFLDTEARQLDGYYVTDSGIRQVGANFLEETYVATIGTLIPYRDSNNSFNESMLVCVDGKVYRKTGGGVAPVQVTHSGTIADDKWNFFTFSQNIYLINSSQDTQRFQISNTTLNANPFGPINRASTGWSYKGRVYIVEYLSSTPRTSVWYGDPAAITGTLTEFPMASIFNSPNSIIWGSSWSVNLGLESQELWVVCTADGEVVVYAGDSPEDTEWHIVGRTTIPKPLSSRSFLRIADDIYVQNENGAISLKAVFTGEAVTAQYYAISRKLGNALGGGNSPIVRHTQLPYIYFPSNTGYAYVLNNIRGAWSRLPLEVPGVGVAQMAFWEDRYASTPSLWFTNGSTKLYQLRDTVVDTARTYTWRTPHFDFGKPVSKVSDRIRVYSRVTADGGGAMTDEVVARAAISSQFDDANLGNYSTKTGHGGPWTSSQAPVRTLELSPTGEGRQLSYTFSETPSSGHKLNEYLGFQAYFQPGGVQ